MHVGHLTPYTRRYAPRPDVGFGRSVRAPGNRQLGAFVYAMRAFVGTVDVAYDAVL
jgi:hypothetical protein